MTILLSITEPRKQRVLALVITSSSERSLETGNKMLRFTQHDSGEIRMRSGEGDSFWYRDARL
jgi:hypothetical protein